MKIIFKRQALAAAIAPLMATVASRSTVGAVDGILIEAKKPNEVILTTYDLDKGMRTKVEATVEEEGYYIVNAQKFNQILYVMENDEIVMVIDDKNCATLVSGRSAFRLNALDGEDFPAVPALKSEMGFYISQKVFREILAKTTYAMGTVDQRPVLNGCFVHVDDDSIMVVACDSFKLAKCTHKAEIKKGNESDRYISYSFILPQKTVAELYKLLSNNEDEITRIFLMRKHIVFEIGNIVFFSRLIEGEYIDYDRIILTEHKINAVVDRDALLSALERAALITEEKILGSVRSHVKMNILGDIIEVSAVSTNGSSYDEVASRKEGNDILIAFNNRYLMDSIRSCNTEKIKLSLSTPLTSMNIEPVDADDGIEEIYMLLPVRMKE